MRGSKSVGFNVGLAACASLAALPVIPWIWPFDEESGAVGWIGSLVAAFILLYTLARVVDVLVSEMEECVEGIVAARFGRIKNPSYRPPRIATPSRTDF